MDHLSGGASCSGSGLGAPGGRGWYGQSFEKPLARTREYVDIVRQVVARQSAVTSSGPHYRSLSRGTGLGKRSSDRAPLRPRSDHPRRRGPKNVALAAEIATAVPIFFSRSHEVLRGVARRGLRPTGARHSAADFEVIAFAPTVIADDVERAADAFRRSRPLCRGHGGTRDELPFRRLRRMGYEERRQDPDLYLDATRTRRPRRCPPRWWRTSPHRRRRRSRRPRGLARVHRTSLLVSGDPATLETMPSCQLSQPVDPSRSAGAAGRAAGSISRSFISDS